MSTFLVTGYDLVKNKKLTSPMLAVMGLAVVASSIVMPNNKAHAISSGNYDYELLADGTAEITGYFGSSTSVSIPSTIDGKKVTSIGEDAFNPDAHYSMKKVTSVTIPTSVTNIGTSAFEYSGLTTIKIPDSVISIGEDAFYSTPLKTVIFGKNLKTIGNSAFLSTKLTSVTIPNSVTSIGNLAFKYNAITSVTLGTGLTTIGEDAFAYNQLTSLTIPSNVTTLGNFAFAENENLTKVTVQNPNLTYGTFVYNVYTKSPHDVVIYASKGSTSESYAKEYNHTFYTSANDELATKAVEEAEDSLDQSDVTYAQQLVNRVEDTNEKASLQDRLDAVQDIIDQQKALSDATNAVGLAESTKTINDFNTAQNLVTALPNSTDKTDLQNRLDALTDYINQQQEAINAVEKAESTKTQDDVDTARPLVDALDNGTVKTDLTNRLDAVQDAIDKAKAEAEAEQKATEAVEQAESTKTQADVDTARDLVKAVTDETVKTDLTNRLDKVQEDIDAQKAIDNATQATEKAETTVTQADVDTARNLVNALPDGTVKDDLSGRLDAVQKAIDDKAVEDATNAVEKAESSKTQEDVDSAKPLVNALPEGTVKDDLNNRLDKVQEAIDKAKAEKDTIDAVEKAESTKTQEDVNTAKELVNKLPDGAIKDDLNNRLDKVQEDIDKAKAEAEATQATEKAESSKTQDDVDKAKDLVNKLPDGSVKDDLTNRLDKVQEEIDKAKAEAEAEQKATEATEKAEASKTQEDVDTAKELVNKLPDGSVKDDLTNRLDKVQEAIDKAKAEAEATQAVEKAESTKKQDDVDKARTIVDALPDGIVKEDLTNRLNELQKAIDESCAISNTAHKTLAGTPLDQDLCMEIQGGELSLTNSDITPFEKIKLGEDTKTVSTNFTAPFTVKDLTGNQLGYRVDVSATQFTDGTNVLPKGTLSLEPVQKIERVGTGIGNSPVSKLEANQILDDGQSTLISANVGEGMGVYNLTFPEKALSISVNPTTTKIDGDSAEYTSTITWDLVQAP